MVCDRGYEVYPMKMSRQLKEILVQLKTFCENSGCLFLPPRSEGLVLSTIPDDKGDLRIGLVESDSPSHIKNHNCIVGCLRRPIGN